MMPTIQLVIVDELHFLGEKSERAGGLEVLMCRFLANFQSVRIVGTSATIPNAAQLAKWLSATCLEFGEEHRPNPLE